MLNTVSVHNTLSFSCPSQPGTSSCCCPLIFLLLFLLFFLFSFPLPPLLPFISPSPSLLRNLLFFKKDYLLQQENLVMNRTCPSLPQRNPRLDKNRPMWNYPYLTRNKAHRAFFHPYTCGQTHTTCQKSVFPNKQKRNWLEPGRLKHSYLQCLKRLPRFLWLLDI